MFFGTVPSKDDFDGCTWQDVIAAAKEKDCHVYSTEFHKTAQEAETSGETARFEVFKILAALASLHLDHDSEEQVFRPMFVLSSGSRSAAAEDFTDGHIALLGEVVHGIADPEMRARMADLIWVRKRDARAGALAVESYMLAGRAFKEGNNEVRASERFERAAHAAASLGRRHPALRQVLNELASLVEKHVSGSSPFLFWRIGTLLALYKYQDTARLAPFAHAFAEKAEASANWIWARHCYELEGRFHALNKATDKARDALVRIAETYVKEATERLAGSHPSYMVASHHIASAIEALRKARDTKERRQELHSLLLQYQQRGMKEMISHTEPIDVSDCAAQSMQMVEGKDVLDGILILATAFRPQSLTDLRAQAEKALANYISRFIFPRVIVNEKGRTVARPRNHPLTAKQEESEGAIRAEMVQFSDIYRSVGTNGVIEPIRTKLCLDHDIRLWHLGEIVMNNPFIPMGREAIYARGLYAGMRGDFLTAAHLLIPQLEESIRHILSQEGVITSGLDAEGIQNEHDLNTTLYAEGLEAILGDDIVFDLQSLLVDHAGANLRNRLAHGLMHMDEFFSPHVVYFWWLMLRLCCSTIIQQMNKKTEVPSPHTEGGDTEPGKAQ